MRSGRSERPKEVLSEANVRRSPVLQETQHGSKHGERSRTRRQKGVGGYKVAVLTDRKSGV